MIGRGVGCVVRTLGESVLASLPTAAIGDGVCIRVGAGTLRGQVVAIDRSRVTIVPFGSLAGISIGDRVEVRAAALAAPVGFGLLGRAISANGEPLDGRGRVHAASVVAGAHAAPAPGDRLPVNYPFFTGIRAIDGLLSIGRGARIGFFGAPGAGKSTLLETIAAGASGDAVVLALVGERGREAQRWFERLDARTTIVCATSDRGAAERIRAADVAMEHAAYLRARGLHVVLVVDSLARYANSLREARVALGEPVGRGGYPPSVWAHLARYVERAGNGSSGSITLLATVLTDGSDEREPLADAARSLLDGHIVLSPSLAAAGHYPAVDVLASASRTMADVADDAQRATAVAVRDALALLASSKDARDLGMATPDVRLRAALDAEPALLAFLRQRGAVAPRETREALSALAARLESA